MSKKTITSFFQNEYVNASSYDNLRKIASLIDGQKNASRKILHTILEKNIKSKIKVSQLGSKVAEFCLTGETLINTIEYGLITIKALIDKELDSFNVLCIDEEGNEQVGIGKNARFMKETDELIEIYTETEIIRCTLDHKILIKRKDKNVWVEAKDLSENDHIVNV